MISEAKLKGLRSEVMEILMAKHKFGAKDTLLFATSFLVVTLQSAISFGAMDVAGLDSMLEAIRKDTLDGIISEEKLKEILGKGLH